MSERLEVTNIWLFLLDERLVWGKKRMNGMAPPFVTVSHELVLFQYSRLIHQLKTTQRLLPLMGGF